MVDGAGLGGEVLGDRRGRSPGSAIQCSEWIGVGQVAAGELVLALGAGLDAGEAVRDRPVDGLVVAELEVQERVLARRSPSSGRRARRRR